MRGAGDPGPGIVSGGKFSCSFRSYLAMTPGEMLTNANIFNQNGTNDFHICPTRPAKRTGLYNYTPTKQKAVTGQMRA